jgi:alkylation response protein AidB-like acyl-CoA dehydrogenase
MTFELTPEQLALRDRARTFAQTVLQPRAADIDRTGSVTGEILSAALDLRARHDGVNAVVVIEELSAVSGTVALLAALPPKPGTPLLGLSGLRGAPTFEDSNAAQLLLAAVTLGLGRAALDASLALLRAAAAQPGTRVDAPHWVVADVAAELDGARLLTFKAATAMNQGAGEVEVAMARLMASTAATHAVDAALRIAGPDGYRDGSLLERLARDVRAVALVAGTEERQRAHAAEGLLPQ